MSGYGDKSFWDNRYRTQEGKYDWYLGYSQLAEAMLPYMNVKDSSATSATAGSAAAASSSAAAKPDAKTEEKRDRSSLRTLIVGCGNSDLSENMFDDGFTNQVSIDYSEVVIQKMNESLKDKPAIKFEAMDCRDLRYKDSEFDMIIDKGTLDAILCGNDSAKNSSDMLDQCSRVLKPGGVFFIFTYGQPQSRLSYLEKPKLGWTVSYQVLGKTKFMYVLQKKAV
jgi:SAM-dependent methyltransferase